MNSSVEQEVKVVVLNVIPRFESCVVLNKYQKFSTYILTILFGPNYFINRIVRFGEGLKVLEKIIQILRVSFTKKVGTAALKTFIQFWNIL